LSYIESTALAGQDTNEFFGKSLSVYDNKVAIAQNGKVTVYVNVSGTVWDYEDSIIGDTSNFGYNVELYDDRLAIATGTGDVNLYRATGLSATPWLPATPHVISGFTNTFGSDIKFIDQTNVIVADPNSNLNHFNGGEVCKYNIGNPITCTDIAVIPDLKKNDFFGSSIDINGAYLVVGAWGRTVRSKTNVGEVFVYNLGDFTDLKKILTPPENVLDARFGSSVSINAASDILVGASNEKVRRFKGTGRAHLFQGENVWSLTRSVSPDSSKLYGHFGTKVLLQDNGIAWIGQPGHDKPANNQGRIFKYSDITSSEIYDEINLLGEHPSSYIGKTFVIINEDIIIGIPNFTSNGKQFHGIAILLLDQGDAIFFGEEEVFYGLEQVFG
jgi:hypothetical protein